MTSTCATCGNTLTDAVVTGLCAACLLHIGSGDTSPEDVFQLEPGSSAGPYEIVSALGRGGMGQVYLAWDTRLCRTVAIKVLAAPFATDQERIHRLEREARIVAGLNHPRICAVYDLGRERDLNYIVMEHLDGQTLATRLEHGPLPVAEAVTLAIEIADGLDGAHRHDITHRDLKPANIMLTTSGAKLLDFGLAVRSYRSGIGVPASRTADYVSGLGGTIQYMAPEQLEGKSADVRSDVFSFGLVLHEMLTGRPACAADDAEQLVARVAAADVQPASVARPEVPAALQRILNRCLQRDPEARWQSLRDVLFELTAIRDEPERVAAPGRPALADRYNWLVASAAVAILATVVGARVVTMLASPAGAVAHSIRFVAGLPRSTSDAWGTGGLAFVSPDGRSLVWVTSSGDGKTRLAVHRFDDREPIALQGTDGARWPFWSPDSASIAFFAQGELRRIQASGGAVSTIAKAPYGQGGTWSTHSTILFAPSPTEPLYEVPDHGGRPRAVTRLDAARGERAHQWPALLPDGRQFVYFASSDRPEHKGLHVGSLDSAERRYLGASDAGAVWSPPGYLLFTRSGMLIAQRLDAREKRFVGEPHMLEQHACGTSTIVPPCVSASTNGVLVYHVARLYRHQLAWFSRTGRELDVPIQAGSYFSPVLSPDGRHVLLEGHDPKSWELGLWNFDLGRGVLSPVHDARLPANAPLWSRDGRAIAFTTNTEHRHDIYTMPAHGGTPQRLASAAKFVMLTDWSPDGRQILFQARGDTTGVDVWTLPAEGGREPVPLLQSRFNEMQARWSPDGRWLAYSSDESGRLEVYVQPVPFTGARWQLTSDGGHEATWRGDSRELFYLTGDRRFMAVPVQPAKTFAVGPAVELFRVPRDAPFDSRISYAPAPDGQRFLLNIAARDRVRLPLFETQVVVNWTATIQN